MGRGKCLRGDLMYLVTNCLIRENNIYMREISERFKFLHCGRTIIKIPLFKGALVVAVRILGVQLLAGLCAVVALVTECTIKVEKVDKA
jgi:hypothetical protein